MVKSKGLGDSIEKILKKIGADKVAKTVLGDDCGCKERRDKLNKMFPYKNVRQFTKDELAVYEEILPRLQESTITAVDRRVVTKLYNKVFEANKKDSNCTSCVIQTLKALEHVYKNSCNLDEEAH
mgnify:CR=1 FL=1|tara:strand:- start:456 stop:830 length:375 start_codon:yes stop_codon:yes gene_type:complete